MLPRQITTYHAKLAIDKVRNDPLLTDDAMRGDALGELVRHCSMAPIAAETPADAVEPPQPSAPKKNRRQAAAGSE